MLEFRQLPAWAQHSTTGAVPTQPSAPRKDELSAPPSDGAAAVESLKVALEAEKQKHHVRTHAPPAGWGSVRVWLCASEQHVPAVAGDCRSLGSAAIGQW
eukprot:COSAG01_NODE_906_length_12834_cov_53.626620_12_plen_100_part_00